MMNILLTTALCVHLKAEGKIPNGDLTKVLSTTDPDKEGCYDAFTKLAESLVVNPSSTSAVNPSTGAIPTQSPVPTQSPEPTEVPAGVRRKMGNRRNGFDWLSQATDPLVTFKEQCPTTAAGNDCADLVSKLTDNTATQNEKNDFTTVCKVDEPNNNDAGQRILKFSHVLLVISLSIATLFIN
jgi:hypothetical protein